MKLLALLFASSCLWAQEPIKLNTEMQSAHLRIIVMPSVLPDLPGVLLPAAPTYRPYFIVSVNGARPETKKLLLTVRWVDVDGGIQTLTQVQDRWTDYAWTPFLVYLESWQLLGITVEEISFAIKFGL
jgi:hypothetical protein